MSRRGPRGELDPEADPPPPTVERLNLLPMAAMAGGWLGPLIMFWSYVWGPLRPFDYPRGDLAPPAPEAVVAFLLCLSAWWTPAWYHRVFSFEVGGRLYERLGVRRFRWIVPDGDLVNRLHRRRQPGYRLIRNRREAEAFVRRTVRSEKGHLVLLLFGSMSAAHAFAIGWRGWACFLLAGNVVVNLYPILLQRYTRSRLEAIRLRADRRGRVPV